MHPATCAHTVQFGEAVIRAEEMNSQLTNNGFDLLRGHLLLKGTHSNVRSETLTDYINRLHCRSDAVFQSPFPASLFSSRAYQTPQLLEDLVRAQVPGSHPEVFWFRGCRMRPENMHLQHISR